MSRDTKVMLGMGIAFAAVIVIIIFGVNSASKPAAPVDNSILVRAQSHGTGSISAKVTMVEFGDYECPACGAAHPLIKQLISDYSSNPNFNFIFRNFPLPQHANAQITAEAAEAAAAQGKFWEMHDMIYENQNEWADSTKPLDILVSYAQKIGLDVAKFKQDVQANKYASVIAGDLTDGQTLGVDATPTFYINGVKMVGISSINDLKTKIDALLAQ